MNKYIYIIMLLGAVMRLDAQQSLHEFLAAVDVNNTTLQTLRHEADVRIKQSDVGRYLPNPEVEFNYLLGSRADEGNRIDFVVRQSFDFPTAYYHRAKLARHDANAAQLQFEQSRHDILLQAAQAYVEYVFYNDMAEKLNIHLRHVQRIADAVERLFDNGQATVIDRNKSRLNLLNARKEVEANAILLNSARNELVRLNGGNDFDSELGQFPPYVVPENFDEWFANIEQKYPALRLAQSNILKAERALQLGRANWLPKFSAGYMSESQPNIQFRGITLGLSIPLWENKNTVRVQRIQNVASRAAEVDICLALRSRLADAHGRAANLRKALDEYNEILASGNSDELLEKALSAGHITLIESIVEHAIFHEAQHNMLITERDFRLALVELIVAEM